MLQAGQADITRFSARLLAMKGGPTFAEMQVLTSYLHSMALPIEVLLLAALYAWRLRKCPSLLQRYLGPGIWEDDRQNHAVALMFVLIRFAHVGEFSRLCEWLLILICSSSHRPGHHSLRYADSLG